MLVTSDTGRLLGPGLRWQSRHQLMLRGIMLRDRFHLVDSTVTGHTANAGRHVHVVGEIREVRKLVDANPVHRPAAGVAVANRCEFLAVLLHERMAVDAGARRRNVRHGGRLDRGVAVSAIETKLADVELVAVGYGLNGTVAHVGVPRGKGVPDARDRERRTDAACNGGQNRELVPPRRKNLSQWLGFRARQSSQPRVLDGTVMPHPCARQKIRRRRTTEDPVY